MDDKKIAWIIAIFLMLIGMVANNATTSINDNTARINRVAREVTANDERVTSMGEKIIREAAATENHVEVITKRLDAVVEFLRPRIKLKTDKD